MATVGIWKISSNLKQVIKYTTNEKKTDISNFSDLDKSLEYIKDEFKTEDKLFVSSINCNVECAFEDMIRTKKRFNKTNGILGFHAYQSFRENEVTPELAHKIGVDLANEMWGDRFEVVVSTHLNTNHYHNHFVINSVSFMDGKRYYDNRTTYAELRRLNDCICKDNNLSYLEEKKTRKGINYLNYQNKSTVHSNYYKTAKTDLDLAISKAHSYKNFLDIIENLGYEVNDRSGKLSIRGQNYKRNIRIERYFGDDYSIENIIKQIKGLYIPTNRNYYKSNINSLASIKTLIKPKYNSFYGLYLRYCRILNDYPKYIRKNSISPGIKKDIEKLEELNNQTRLLVSNNIETETQFLSFYNSKELELSKLKQKREELNRDKKDNHEDEIRSINLMINKLKKEIKICETIRTTKDKVKENISLLKEKEMINDEYIR